MVLHDGPLSSSSDPTKDTSSHTTTTTNGSPPTTQPLYDVCKALKQKLDAFLAKEGQSELLRGVQGQVRVAIEVVKEALTRYRLEQIALSYNGGKDCLVLLIILLACLADHIPPSFSSSSDNETPPQSSSSSSSDSITTIQSLYIVSPNPFSEVDDFVTLSSQTYHLQVSSYQMSMKHGLGAYLKDRPGIEAIFVGTRRTDPHGASLTHFDMTDEGWPTVMRVHPVIDWKYVDIWAFLRELEIPYCSLYDQGYSSLGGTIDTFPNPQLKKEGEDGFLPAYELVADDEERLGRPNQ